MSFSYFARRSKQPLLLQLVPLIKKLRARKRRPIGTFVEELGVVIQLLGWRTKDVHPALFEERRNIIAVLNEVASMSGLLRPTTWHKVAELIRFTANNTQTESVTTEAPIQVMSREQSRLLHFDALWVGNVSDADWPDEPSPNPFIPIGVQREARMPNVTHADLLNTANVVLGTWFGGANELVFSYANDDEDSENQPSALLNNIEQTTTDGLLTYPEHAQYQHPWGLTPQYAATETFVDEAGSRINATKPVRHRTAMLKNQLECPFRSWGLHRLNVVEDQELNRFLSPAERGNVIHEVLSKIASEGMTRADISNISSDTIEKQTKKSIHRAHLGLPKFYVLSETKHILGLIHEWMRFESEQGDFQILAAEKAERIVIGKSKFQIRIDRIDRTQDHSYVITDYKTGAARSMAGIPTC